MAEPPASQADPWARLRLATRARIGLARAGDAMTVGDVLAFQLAHARARDAVHAGLDIDGLQAELGPGCIAVRSRADSREIYLRRPDLGRRLHPDCEHLLPRGDFDAVFVIADGLSAAAVSANALPTLRATLARLPGWNVAPPVLASQARVALGDEIGWRLNARLCAVLIGERPGLSVAESLGVYLTFNPRQGVPDSARNCISNIHRDGLSAEAAADTLAWLMREALRRRVTGVTLKEAAGLAPGLEPPPEPA